MCRIGIKSNEKKTFTKIPNRFIDEYMADANGSYLKVYLYIQSFLSQNRDFSLSEIADRMDYAEKDILRALRYWEKKGILEFASDKDGNITSLYLRDLTEDDDTAATVPAAPVSPAASNTPAGGPSAPVPAMPEHPNHSLENLIRGIEDRLGRPIGSRDELGLVSFLREELGFPEDLILHLYQYCVEQTGNTRGKGLNRYIETVAINWNRDGITCLADLMRINAPYEEAAGLFRQIFSLHDPVNSSQRAYLNKWSGEWGMPLPVMEEAFRRAADNGTASCRYIDAILKRWHEAGVTSAADIECLDQSHAEQKQKLENMQKNAMINKGRGSASPNQFHNFDQREYSSEDWAEIERQMLRNS